MYTAVNGNHHLLKCEIIKKLAVSVLDSSSSENAGLLKKVVTVLAFNALIAPLTNLF